MKEYLNMNMENSNYEVGKLASERNNKRIGKAKDGVIKIEQFAQK